MVAKIPLSVLAAFIISISILSLSLFLYHYKLHDGIWVFNAYDNVSAEKAYLQHFPVHQKKILLIGSSQIQALNPIYIHEDLLNDNLNYTIYNLGVPSDN